MSMLWAARGGSPCLIFHILIHSASVGIHSDARELENGSHSKPGIASTVEGEGQESASHRQTWKINMCLPTRWSTWETLLRNNKRRKHSLLLSFPCLHTLPERFLEVSKHSLVSRSNYFQGQRCPPGHLYLGPQFWEREVLQPSLGSCFLVLEALEADWFGSYFKVLFTSPGVFTRARRSGSSTAVLPLLVWTLSALAVETLQCRGGTGLGGMSVSSVTCTSLCTSKGKDRVDVVFFFYFFFLQNK